MKLFVPACGDRLILSKPWTFMLWLESRNMKFAKARGFAPKSASHYGGVWEGARWGRYKQVEVTLPEGTIIECDRVYIRTFNKSRVNDGDDYDSITWKIIDRKKGKMEKFGRFWVKLTAANEVEFELEADSLYRDRVKVFKEVMET